MKSYAVATNIAWRILGEGEYPNGDFFTGSMAEATDDALNVMYAVMTDDSVVCLTTYKAWKRKQP